MSIPLSAPSGALDQNAARDRTTLPALVGFAVVLGSLWASWQRFPSVWNASREHGFAVAALVMWLVWRDRDVLLKTGTAHPLLALPLAAASVVWMLAVFISAQVVHLLLVPVILLGWLLVVRGPDTGARLLPIAALAMLAIPVWEVLLPLLQGMTVFVNSIAVRLSGIEAVITGTQIRLPFGTLEVAESCAGLNYLSSGLTLGAAYALAFLRDRRTQVKVLVLAAVISIVSNWIRVFGLVVAAHVTKMQSSLMQEHGVYGWIIFACTLPVFGWAAARIERRAIVAGAEPTSGESNETGQPTPFDLKSVALATGAAICGPLLLIGLSAWRSPAPMPTVLAGVTPMTGWQPAVNEGQVWVTALKGYSEHLVTHWENGGRRVQVDRFAYREQRQGAEMVSSSNRLAVDSLLRGEQTIGPLDQQLRTVRESVVQVDRSFRLAWWWYRVAGIDTPVGTKAQLLELWSAVSNAPASEIVVVSAPCGANDCAAAREAVHEVVVGSPLSAPRKN